jgi:3-oxoacyl-[acyl-carrier-protein] synthase III
MASTLEHAGQPAAAADRLVATPSEVAPAEDAAARAGVAARAGALGLGAALPGTVVGNDRVAREIGVDEEWIARRTGVRERRHAAPGAQLCELAADAGRAALEDAGLDARALDLLIVATFTPDAILPPASAVVAHRLGATRASTFDLNNACCGFVSALAVADALIRAGAAKHALVIGAEIVSRHLDPADRKTAAVFGDGAGALALVPGAPGGFGPFVSGADGSQAHLITTDAHDGTLRMDGHDTFKQAVKRLAEVSHAACAAAGVELHELDLLVFHQANARITSALGERLGVDGARVVDCIAALGNTSAASIPLALVHARREGKLAPGQRVLLAAVGAGFTWGATVVDWELA